MTDGDSHVPHRPTTDCDSDVSHNAMTDGDSHVPHRPTTDGDSHISHSLTIQQLSLQMPN